jgi:hypothetical protein
MTAMHRDIHNVVDQLIQRLCCAFDADLFAEVLALHVLDVKTGADLPSRAKSTFSMLVTANDQFADEEHDISLLQMIVIQEILGSYKKADMTLTALFREIPLVKFRGALERIMQKQFEWLQSYHAMQEFVQQQLKEAQVALAALAQGKAVVHWHAGLPVVTVGEEFGEEEPLGVAPEAPEGVLQGLGERPGATPVETPDDPSHVDGLGLGARRQSADVAAQQIADLISAADARAWVSGALDDAFPSAAAVPAYPFSVVDAAEDGPLAEAGSADGAARQMAVAARARAQTTAAKEEEESPSGGVLLAEVAAAGETWAGPEQEDSAPSTSSHPGEVESPGRTQIPGAEQQTDAEQVSVTGLHAMDVAARDGSHGQCVEGPNGRSSDEAVRLEDSQHTGSMVSSRHAGVKEVVMMLGGHIVHEVQPIRRITEAIPLSDAVKLAAARRLLADAERSHNEALPPASPPAPAPPSADMAGTSVDANCMPLGSRGGNAEYDGRPAPASVLAAETIGGVAAQVHAQAQAQLGRSPPGTSPDSTVDGLGSDVECRVADNSHIGADLSPIFGNVPRMVPSCIHAEVVCEDSHTASAEQPSAPALDVVANTEDLVSFATAADDAVVVTADPMDPQDAEAAAEGPVAVAAVCVGTSNSTKVEASMDLSGGSASAACDGMHVARTSEAAVPEKTPSSSTPLDAAAMPLPLPADGLHNGGSVHGGTTEVAVSSDAPRNGAPPAKANAAAWPGPADCAAPPVEDDATASASATTVGQSDCMPIRDVLVLVPGPVHATSGITTSSVPSSESVAASKTDKKDAAERAPASNIDGMTSSPHAAHDSLFAAGMPEEARVAVDHVALAGDGMPSAANFVAASTESKTVDDGMPTLDDVLAGGHAPGVAPVGPAAAGRSKVIDVEVDSVNSATLPPQSSFTGHEPARTRSFATGEEDRVGVLDPLVLQDEDPLVCDASGMDAALAAEASEGALRMRGAGHADCSRSDNSEILTPSLCSDSFAGLLQLVPEARTKHAIASRTDWDQQSRIKQGMLRVRGAASAVTFDEGSEVSGGAQGSCMGVDDTGSTSVAPGSEVVAESTDWLWVMDQAARERIDAGNALNGMSVSEFLKQRERILHGVRCVLFLP